MARPKAGARLYKRPDTHQWVIRDSGKPEKRLPFFGEDGRGEAEKALAGYIRDKHGLPAEPQSPEHVPVSTVLTAYAVRRGGAVQAPARIGYAMDALLAFWGDRPCGDIDEDSCNEFVSWRLDGGLRKAQLAAGILDSKTREKTSRSTARRDLGVLQAAVKSATKLLKSFPTVYLPKETEAKPDWLTRSQVAALIWALWTGRYVTRSGKLTRRTKKTRHAARIVLAQFYTGSRPATVSRTTWVKRKDGPWVDIGAATWWRRGDDEPATVKARKPHGIHPRLGAHLSRWKRLYGGSYIVEHARNPGKPCIDIGTSIDSACKRAGIPRITQHGMKYTTITLFIQGGGSAEDAADYFSTSIATIEKTYWHHSPHYQARAIASLGDLGRKPAQKRTTIPANARKPGTIAAEYSFYIKHL